MSRWAGCASLDLVYWGDLDTHGFAILNRLRECFPHARSMLMDRATLLAHPGPMGDQALADDGCPESVDPGRAGAVPRPGDEHVRLRGTPYSVHALATPLITKPDGTKYGKTEGDAVWLSQDLMAAYAFYQFWLNRSDAEVPGLLRVFSFRSRAEIEDLEREIAARPAARLAQRLLAEELTALVHGEVELAKVQAASEALFGQGDLRALDAATLSAAVAEVPHAEVDRLDDGGLPPVADLMAAAGIVPSKSAARRAIAEGGAYLNNERVTTEDAAPADADLLHGEYLIVRRGKRTAARCGCAIGSELPGFRVRHGQAGV